MRLLKRIPVLAGIAAAVVLTATGANAKPLAKDLFGARTLPSAEPPASFGFYSHGCFAGGVGLAENGPHWQVMRPSRNRRWGHPEMIKFLEELSGEAARDGWPGLLIGDISQPRGGPMVTGHASHQVGLDVDIWFEPMPERRLSDRERETVGAQSLLKPGTRELDERKWTPAYAAVLKDAASHSEVERIFVHPAVKKKLCDTVSGNRAWLSKIRPYWGHDDHFHVRISCPADSPGCTPQHEPPAGDGCDKSLAWWFTDEPWRPAKGPAKPKARDIMTMDNLPPVCRSVLAAPAVTSASAATVSGPQSPLLEKPAAPAFAEAYLPIPDRNIPVPTPRPAE